MSSSTPAIQIRDLHTWYGESHILHGINIHVMPGEVVTLLGRNGAGRTTTMRATASICCSPPDRRPPGLPRRAFRLGNMS